MIPNIYLGWDSREIEAYEVAEASIRAAASGPVNITPLTLPRLEQQGLMRRPRVTSAGTMWDEISHAPMSTEFALSRFLPPILCQRGVAMFADLDIIAYGDVYELQEQAVANPDIALWCVHHNHRSGYTTKMDGQPQTYYHRKNWSSVMVFNCEHPANGGLTLELINSRPGRDLHAMCWLHDREIGSLDPAWNWLVGVTERPPAPKIAHYTLGGPWLSNWQGGEYDHEWLSAAARLRPGRVRADQGTGKETVRD